MQARHILTLVLILICLTATFQYLNVGSDTNSGTSEPLVKFDIQEHHGFTEATAPRYQYLVPQTHRPVADSSAEATTDTIAMALVSVVMISVLGTAMAYIYWRRRCDGFDRGANKLDSMALNLVIVAVFGIVACSLGVCLFIAEDAQAATITVTNLGDNTTVNGEVTLREAIQAAETNTSVDGSESGSGIDTIVFHSSLAGSSDATISLSLYDTGLDNGEFGPTAFFITSTLAIQGPSGENGIIIERSSSADAFRIFHVKSGGTLTLENLTIQDGFARGGNGAEGGGGAGGMGGALFNQGTLTISASTFTGNEARGGSGSGGYMGGGGGVGEHGSNHTSSPNGGGGGGDPNAGAGAVGTSTETGGSGGFGGGGGGGHGYGGNGGFGGGGGGSANYNAGNGGFGGGGGGAFYYGGTGGQGGFGGGNGYYGGAGSGGGGGLGGAVFNEGGSVEILNSTFSGNSVVGGVRGLGTGGSTGRYGVGGSAYGAGLFNRNGDVEIVNCTFANNTVTAGTGGSANAGSIYNLGDGQNWTGTVGGTSAAVISIDNTILADSTGGSNEFVGNIINSGTSTTSGIGNLFEGHSGFSGTVVSTSDPILGTLADNDGPTQTHALDGNSAALNAGSNSVASGAGLTTDQRGTESRVVGGQVDIGSFELFIIDLGDAPDTYSTTLPDGAHHVLTGLRLGATVDVDLDGQPGAAANGDDTDSGGDDEDGVTFPATLLSANEATASHIIVAANDNANLDAWIDFDGNGVFDHPSEHLNDGTSFNVTNGDNVIPFNIPARAVSGQTYARFRLSSAGGLEPTGLADSGEVEDYTVQIVDGSTASPVTIDQPGTGDGTIRVSIDGIDLVVTDQNTGIQLFRAPTSAVSQLTLNGGAGTDTLVFEGMESDDLFDLEATTGTISLQNAAIGGAASPISVAQTGIENLVLSGIAGNDLFVVNGTQPYTDVSFENYSAPIPTALWLDPTDDTGISNSDNVTGEDEARIFIEVDLSEFADAGIDILDPNEVAANEPGAAITVLVNGISVGNATPITGTNNMLFEFTFSPGDLSTTFIPVGGGMGLNVIRATVCMYIGQGSLVSSHEHLSDPLLLKLDATAPLVPTATLLSASDSFDNVTGLIGAQWTNSDDITNEPSPAFSGTAEAGTALRLYADGELVGQTVVGSDESNGTNDGLGVWEITCEPLFDGTYDLTLEIEDATGNVTPFDPALSQQDFIIDTIAPQRPTLDLINSDDTGNSATDDITDATDPLDFTVTAETGTRVLIKNGETVIDDFIMAGTSMTRSLTLAEGTHLLSAEAFDSAGNRSAQSEELVLTLDTTDPTADIGGPYSCNEGSLIVLTAAASSDGTGSGIVSYEWDCDDDGLFDDATGVTISCSWDDNGSYDIAVRVTDYLDHTDTDTTTVTVNNVAPTVDAGADDTIDEGDTFTGSGSFTDPGTADTWIATVDYGDGSGVQSLTLSGTSFSLSHTYTDNGSYTVTVTVTDDDSDPGSDTLTVTVDNAAPTASFDNDGPKDEGSLVTVSFSGQSDSGTADTFTYSFDWNNDGTYEIVDQAGASASYTWYDNGVFTVKGRIKDNDGGFNEYTTDVTVNNVDPTASFGNDGPEDEGSSVLVSFTGQTDPGTLDTFTYSFDWDNDGTYDIIDQTSAAAAHTWNDNGTYTVKGQIKDDDGGFNEYTTMVTVNNVAPEVSAGADDTIDEGDTFTGAGTFTDPGDDTWTATVDYGDGSGAQPLTLVGKTFSLSHIYADNGNYTVTVTVTDDDSGTDSDTLSVTVDNVAPVVDVGAGDTINEGDTFTGAGSFTDPGLDSWTATVDYGDGSGAQPLTLVGKTFSPSHIYADNGTYTVTVSVTDDDSGTDSDTLSVTVENVSPIVDAGSDATVTLGDAFTGSGSFADPGADSWSATIDYGDGSGVQPLTLVGKTFSLSHLYASNGTYTVTVVVTDDDTGSGSDTAIVVVSDEPPEAIIQWDPVSREMEVSGTDDIDTSVDVSESLLGEVVSGDETERTYQYTLEDDSGNTLVMDLEITTSENAARGYTKIVATVLSLTYNGAAPIVPVANDYTVYYWEDGGSGDLTNVITQVYSFGDFRVRTGWPVSGDRTKMDEWVIGEPFVSSVVDGLVVVDLKTEEGTLWYEL